MFNLNNIIMICRMSIDIKFLIFLKKVYKIYKNNDDSFNKIKLIKLMFSLIKNEKIIKYKNQYIINSWMPPVPSKSMLKMIKAVPNPKNILFQHSHGIKKAPTIMSICVTKKCINKCDFCSARERNSGKELTTKEWKKVIDELKNMETSSISFTGGEPLLRKDLAELVKYIGKDMRTDIRTSGYNLDLELAQLFKKNGLFSVEIGIDLFDSNNKIIKNKKDLNTSLIGIDSAREAGLYVIAQIVLGKEYINEKKIFSLFKWLKENGVKDVKILEPIIMGDLYYSKKDLNKLLYTNEDRKKLSEIQTKINKKIFLPKMSYYSFYENKDNMGCNAGIQTSYISETGELFPCDFIPISFGNVKNEKVSELFLNMTKKIGKPKTYRLCNKFNKYISNKNNFILPLSEEKGLKIIHKFKSNGYPGLYKSLQ